MADNAVRFAEPELSPEEKSDALLKAFKEGAWAAQYRAMIPSDRRKARAFFVDFTMNLDKKDAQRKAA
jgi:hypothetical protein